MSNQSEVARKESNGGTSADPGGRAANAESTLRPAVDIFETDEGITLQADMPGVSKERLNVRVEGTNLLVEGEIAITRQEEMQALYADVRSATYRRSFLLSGELESSRIEANLKDGVLTVRIPKRAELRPRRIEVRAE
jgi:HSP20 family molecular chaperone IbpA